MVLPEGSPHSMAVTLEARFSRLVAGSSFTIPQSVVIRALSKAEASWCHP